MTSLCQPACVCCIQITPVLHHELQRLAIKVTRKIKFLDHVQLICAHVYKVLVQSEGPDMGGVKVCLLAVGLTPEVLLATGQ